MGLFGSIDSWARPRHSRAGILATLVLALAAYPLLTAGANGPSLDGPTKAVASVPTAKLERKGRAVRLSFAADVDPAFIAALTGRLREDYAVFLAGKAGKD